LNTYEQLKGLQHDIEKTEDNYETKQKTLESLIKKDNKLEADRLVFEQRKVIEEKKGIIANAIKWEKFKVLRKQVKETRDAERALALKRENLERTREPVKTFLKDYEEKVGSLREKTAVAENEYHKAGDV
jgi:hypothetical protein